MRADLIVFFLVLCLSSGCALLPKKHPYSGYRKVIPQQTLNSRFWQNARNEVDKDVLEIAAQDQAEKERGVQLNKFFRGDHGRKRIAITFDDGPHPDFTPEILKILKENKVKATFFLVGNMAENYPELVKTEQLAGHSIGNHTYDHVDLTKIPPEDAAAEIKACGAVLEVITGQRPFLMRPPGGNYSKDIAVMAENLGYTLVLWSRSAADCTTVRKDKRVSQRTLENSRNGDVLIFHDGVPQTLVQLPGLIATLKKRGYEFVTVDEMLPASARVSREASAWNLL